MDIRIIAALKEEFDYPEYQNRIHYSGIGKVNAAIVATEVILNHHPETIINVGTVGALETSMVGLYECGIFQDRDLVGDFNAEILITDENKHVCSTGDRFLTKRPFKGVKVENGFRPDFADMEAYAIAAVCRRYDVKFLCYKFVTDYVNEESSIDWKENIGKGNSLFRKKLDDYLSNPV
jgi:adenosylhomocysteine nucleosidase